MTLKEFCSRSRKTEKTILNRYQKNRSQFPGVKYEKGKWTIPDGTRFPYDRRHLAKTSKDKRYHLLKAIDLYQYIDADMIQLPQESFDVLLSDLITAGLIQENGSTNSYGANKYDCTPKGSEVASMDWKNFASVIKGVGEATGVFVGAFSGAYTKAVLS